MDGIIRHLVSCIHPWHALVVAVVVIPELPPRSGPCVLRPNPGTIEETLDCCCDHNYLCDHSLYFVVELKSIVRIWSSILGTPPAIPRSVVAALLLVSQLVVVMMMILIRSYHHDHLMTTCVETTFSLNAPFVIK
jgi:hypothetical protein